MDTISMEELKKVIMQIWIQTCTPRKLDSGTISMKVTTRKKIPDLTCSILVCAAVTGSENYSLPTCHLPPWLCLSGLKIYMAWTGWVSRVSRSTILHAGLRGFQTAVRYFQYSSSRVYNRSLVHAIP